MEISPTVTDGNEHTGTSRPGFWRRRVVEPLAAFLRQGSTPGSLARAIALGTVCGLFPFLGATTLLCFLAGLLLRLNQPVIQGVNYALGAVQILMIPVFVHGGALLLGADPGVVSVTAMIDSFRELSFVDFIGRFGLAGLYALFGWLVVSPVLFIAVYWVSRPLLERLAAARKEGARS